jgi:hypothetical protein
MKKVKTAAELPEGLVSMVRRADFDNLHRDFCDLRDRMFQLGKEHREEMRSINLRYFIGYAVSLQVGLLIGWIFKATL